MLFSIKTHHEMFVFQDASCSYEATVRGYEGYRVEELVLYPRFWLINRISHRVKGESAFMENESLKYRKSGL